MRREWVHAWLLLMPTTLFLSVNATINAFRMIDHVFVMTQGGPNNASMLLLIGFLLFQRQFVQSFMRAGIKQKGHSMTLPHLGLALTIDNYTPLRDWVCAIGRALEIQDFVAPH